MCVCHRKQPVLLCTISELQTRQIVINLTYLQTLWHIPSGFYHTVGIWCHVQSPVANTTVCQQYSSEQQKL